MKRSIYLILIVVVFIVSSYGAMAAEANDNAAVSPTPCGMHEYESEIITVGNCKNNTDIKRMCKNCKVEVNVKIPAKHTWEFGEKNKLECSACHKNPSISASLVSDDKTLFDGSSCDVPYIAEDGTRVKVDSNCPDYELKCRYNEKYLKVEQNENGEYVINYVKYYSFSTDFLDYFVEFYFVAEDEAVEDNKYSFTLYPTCKQPSISIEKGKKTTLNATVFGAKKAKFSVDKKGKKVVNVKPSKKKAKRVVITGKGKGTATITVNVAGKKVKCIVTVK